jgi:hypothetical protein
MTNSGPSLLLIEMRRALRRRAIRVLIALGIAGCALAGIIAFASSAGKTILEMQEYGRTTHPAVMTDWWVSGGADGMLALGFFFLLLGGLFGGATVAGAEWRFGTITTVLTWEPRRLHLHSARTASAGILAFVISFLLQILFLASFLPAVLVNGAAEGADTAWWLDLAMAMTRISILTSLSAMLAVSLATLGRNTAFALIAGFAWMAVIENLVRAVAPSTQPWLWGENLGIVFTWAQLEGESFTRAPGLALATISVYVGVIAVAAAATFRRRDVAATI